MAEACDCGRAAVTHAVYLDHANVTNPVTVCDSCLAVWPEVYGDTGWRSVRIGVIRQHPNGMYSPPPDEKRMSISQVAGYLDVSPATVLRKAQQGDWPSWRDRNGRWWFRLRDLPDYHEVDRRPRFALRIDISDGIGPDWLTSAEVGQAVGVPGRLITEWARAGKVPGIKGPDKVWLFPPAVREMLSGRRQRGLIKR